MLVTMAPYNIQLALTLISLIFVPIAVVNAISPDAAPTCSALTSPYLKYGATAGAVFPSPELPRQQVDNIIDALIGSGDFASWANILSGVDPELFPLTATLFVPGDDALSHLQTPVATLPLNFDPFLFPYHVVPQRLTFSDLRRLPPHSRLPTLLPDNSILVTNTSRHNFTLDDSPVTHPDLYISAAVSVHAVASLFDYTVYGNRGFEWPSSESVPPAVALTPDPSQISHHHAPPEKLPGGDVAGSRISYAERSVSGVPTVLWLVMTCAAAALKTNG